MIIFFRLIMRPKASSISSSSNILFGKSLSSIIFTTSTICFKKSFTYGDIFIEIRLSFKPALSTSSITFLPRKD